MKQYLFILAICFFVVSCEDEIDPNKDVTVEPGCIDISACNYNFLENDDDGSCLYIKGECDCEGVGTWTEATCSDNNILVQGWDGAEETCNNNTSTATDSTEDGIDNYDGCSEGGSSALGDFTDCTNNSYVYTDGSCD